MKTVLMKELYRRTAVLGRMADNCLGWVLKEKRVHAGDCVHIRWNGGCALQRCCPVGQSCFYRWHCTYWQAWSFLLNSYSHGLRTLLINGQFLMKTLDVTNRKGRTCLKVMAIFVDELLRYFVPERVARAQRAYCRFVYNNGECDMYRCCYWDPAACWWSRICY